MARKMPIFHLLMASISSLGLAACGNGSLDTSNLPPVPPASMFVEQLSPFCTHDTSDKFTAGYFGTHPLDTTVYFYVVCHKGDTLYRDQWPSTWMLSDSLKPDSTKITALHQALHALVEGKLDPRTDSLDTRPLDGQPLFGYRLPQHPAKFLYYALSDHKVHQL